MCIENRNTIQDLEFQNVFDDSNWVFDSLDTLITQSGKLQIKSNNSSNYFQRILGIPSNTNNRINLQIKFRAKKTTQNSNPLEVKFELLNALNFVVFESSVFLQTTVENTYYDFFLKRHYKYQGNLSELKLRIYVIQGLEHTLEIDYIKLQDFNFCSEKVRTYFVVEQLFEQALSNSFGLINLKTWKVDGVETLTSEFLFEQGGNQVAQISNEWLFAKADLDSKNRIALNNQNTNSFNPFVKEFGLDFDSINYYSGKPISVTSGSDYGFGIMEIGVDLPIILNGNLEQKKAPFFIDIDYTKDLFIQFEIVLNDKEEIFNAPKFRKTYEISFNKTTCQFNFGYWIPKPLQFVEENFNGFLFGVPGNIQTIQEVVGGLVKKIEVSPGDCTSWLFGSPIFAEIFIPGSTINYQPQNGDIVYIDENMTQLFDGSAGYKYRMRTETSNPFILNVTFRISPLGEIYDLELCE